jgi:hypothetical protein
MSQDVRPESLPANFPPELAAKVFISRSGETAWRLDVAATTVEWFGTHGYAVLGTELWLLQDGWIQSLPIGTSGLGEVHGNAVERKHENEAWDSYVDRCAAETIRYLKSFNPADIVEKGDLHFQVVWVSEDGYEKLMCA